MSFRRIITWTKPERWCAVLCAAVRCRDNKSEFNLCIRFFDHRWGSKWCMNSAQSRFHIGYALWMIMSRWIEFMYHFHAIQKCHICTYCYDYLQNEFFSSLHCCCWARAICAIVVCRPVLRMWYIEIIWHRLAGEHDHSFAYRCESHMQLYIVLANTLILGGTNKRNESWSWLLYFGYLYFTISDWRDMRDDWVIGKPVDIIYVYCINSIAPP